MTDQEILTKLQAILEDTFEIDPAKVTPETHLFTDLDLDSIDAVDLAIQLQKLTGKRIQPHDFKEVRTVSDVIAAVHRLLGN
jgi:acyl carrier protein